jgi:hypothetical protein
MKLAKDRLSKDGAALLEESASMLTKLNDEALAPCLGPDAMLGPSYLYALLESLRTTGGMRATTMTWRYSVVPQLIDLARSYGAEDLLSAGTRNDWLAEHGTELVHVVDDTVRTLGELDTFLAGLGFRIVVDGTGLARGARVVEATRGRVDISYPPGGSAQTQLELATE